MCQYIGGGAGITQSASGGREKRCDCSAESNALNRNDRCTVVAEESISANCREITE